MKLKLLLTICMIIMSIFIVQARPTVVYLNTTQDITNVYSNTTQNVTALYSNTTQMPCVKEGESLGAVVPGNTAQCCSGLVAFIPKGIVGTRGTCIKSGEISETNISIVSTGDTSGNISIIPIGYQDCSMLKCPNAYFNKDIGQCVCGDYPLVTDEVEVEVVDVDVIAVEPQDCSMLKCPNAYYNKELQKCACGHNSPLTTDVDLSEVTISGVKTANKFVISTSGASGNDCKEYMAGCDAGELVLCDKWRVNCQEKEITIITAEEMVVQNNSLYVNQKEIIMPDKASQTAIEHLALKKTVSIELKDNSKAMSSKTNHKAMYEVIGTKDAKLFALFPTEMAIKTSIDAQTGVIDKVEKPWWGFLAKE